MMRKHADTWPRPNAWRPVGPGGGGAMFHPAISPHDPDHMIVFCDMSGCYTTLDAGRAWTPFSLRMHGFCAAFDPLDPQVAYVGSSGLYRSEDKGRTWTLVYPRNIRGERLHGDEAIHEFLSDGWPGGFIQCVAIHPGDARRMAFALAPAPHLFGKPGRMSVFFTADGGGTWACTQAPLNGTRFRALYFDNADTLCAVTDEALYAVRADMSLARAALPVRSVFSATSGADAAGGHTILYLLSDDTDAAGGPYKTLWRSSTGGARWERLSGGARSTLGGLSNGQQIACCPTDANVLYMTVNRRGEFSPAIHNHHGIQKSVDGGRSFAWVLQVGDDLPYTYEKGWLEESYGFWYVGSPTCMTVSPKNADILAFTNMGACGRTLDGGRTWRTLYTQRTAPNAFAGGGLEVTTCYGVHFDPHNAGHCLISYTDIGLFRSVDSLKSWTHALDGIPYEWMNTCYWAAYDPDIPGRVYSVWGVPHDLPRQKLFNHGHFDAHPEHRAGGAARSVDGGAHWQPCSSGMSPHAVSTHIVLDPRSPPQSRTLYVASCGLGVYKSSNSGETWRLCNEGLGENRYAWKVFLSPDGTLYLLNARGWRDGRVIPGDLYLSTDAAEHWRALPMPGRTGAPSDMAFGPDGRLYLTCWPLNTPSVTHEGGLYTAARASAPWTRVPLPEGAAYTYGVTADASRPGTLYVVDFDQHCFATENGGESWRSVAGYGFKWGHKAFADPFRPDWLYITTFGGGLWHGPADG